MPQDLTNQKILDTYQQLLHLDGGATATDKVVYDGDGTAVGLKVSTSGIDASALKIAGTAVTATAAELNFVDGVTSNIQTQLNAKAGSLSDLGVTSTAAELNLLDGATVTTAEINFVDGVTSSIQSQLNAKVEDLGDLGVTATSTELNVLDGITASTVELNYTDGVTSSIQTQLNAKAPLASPTFTGTVVIPTADINGGTIDGVTLGTNSPVTNAQIDNININGNTVSSTDTNGNIIFDPNGTGFVQEDVGGTDYNLVSQYDIGTAPNEIPLNQYLGNLAYQDAENIAGPVVVGANSSTDALRITQTGTGNALLVEDSANPDSTPFVVGGDGKVLVGITTLPPAIETISPLLSTSSANDANQDIGIYNFRNAGGTGRTTISPRLFFARSRSAVNGSVGGIVVNNEDLGQIRFAGDDGTQFLTAAEILAEVDGTPGTNDMPGRLVFSTTADGASSPTERLRITSAGNVGIGTSTPSFPLTIVKTIADQSSFWSDSTPTLTGNFGNVWSNYQTSTSTHVAAVKLNSASTTTGYITFHTNGANERMRIDSSGNLLVGTTAYTDAKIIVNGNSGAYSYRSNAADTVGSYYHMTFNPAGGTQAGFIYSPNTTTTVYSTTSDYRLKENVAPMQNALATVAQLKPCTYTWKADGSDGQGFIAHELQAVVPDAVTGEKDAINADGSIKPQGVDTSFLVATLTAAIQELSAKVDTLQAELNTLKGI